MVVSDARGCVRAVNRCQVFSSIQTTGSVAWHQNPISFRCLGARAWPANTDLVPAVQSRSGSSWGCDSQARLEEAEMLSKSAMQSPFSASSNPLPASGPGPTQIPKHSEEYKLARVSAFITWLSCFDLRVLVLPRLEKMSPFSSRLDVKVHPGFQTNAPNALISMADWTKIWVLENLTLCLILFLWKLGEKEEKQDRYQPKLKTELRRWGTVSLFFDHFFPRPADTFGCLGCCSAGHRASPMSGSKEGGGNYGTMRGISPCLAHVVSHLP